MHIHQALADVREIQAVLFKTERFRLLRATTVVTTSLLAFLGAGLQHFIAAVPGDEPLTYIAYWSVIAVAGAGCALLATAWRYWIRPTSWDRELWAEASRCFVPALLVGGLITLIIGWRYPALASVLPGIWNLLFGLGVWSTGRVFPRAMTLVAGFYFVAGTVALLAADLWPFSPYWMGIGFGVGQLLMSGVLAYEERRTS